MASIDCAAYVALRSVLGVEGVDDSYSTWISVTLIFELEALVNLMLDGLVVEKSYVQVLLLLVFVPSGSEVRDLLFAFVTRIIFVIFAPFAEIVKSATPPLVTFSPVVFADIPFPAVIVIASVVREETCPLSVASESRVFNPVAGNVTVAVVVVTVPDPSS